MTRELSRERLRALVLMDRIEAGEKGLADEWAACFMAFMRARVDKPKEWR